MRTTKDWWWLRLTVSLGWKPGPLSEKKRRERSRFAKESEGLRQWSSDFQYNLFVNSWIHAIGRAVLKERLSKEEYYECAKDSLVLGRAMAAMGEK